MAQGKSQTQRLNGLPSLAYLGVQPSSPQNFFIKQSNPTTNDYRNCYVGDFWLNNSSMYATPPTAPTAFNLWILVSVANKVATWVQTAGTGIVQSVGAGNNITITGTVAMPIVNVSGTTNHSVLLGNSTGSINSLTNGTTGQILTAQTGGNPIWASPATDGTVTGIGTQDSNTVTPTAGVILLDGGPNLTTTGTVGPNTATISLNGITQHSVQIGGSGGNSLTQLANGTTGQVLTAQTGADPIWNAAPITPTYGSWTPALNFSVSNVGIVYNTQVANWALIGNVCYYQVGIVITAIGSASGNCTITGFPFACASSHPTNAAMFAIDQINLGSGYTYVMGSLISAATSMQCVQYGSNMTFASLTAANWNTAATGEAAISVSGFYFTA